MSGSSQMSKEFFDLVKAIGECKSKQEEDRIVVDQVATLKKRMNEPSTTKKKMREFLVRLIYVEMLGHDGSFGYIKAVELCASTNILQKRVGYLTASLVLSPDHDFRFMLVNQLQRDMASINHLECWAALSALCKLVTKDMIPAVTGDVIRMLKHDTELVRKKAVMALHRFHQLAPDSVSHMVDQARRALCDKHPSVMAASLCWLQDMAVLTPAKFKDLVPSLVSILKQIIEHRLPRDFDYHRMPAPWVQMRLLQIMAVLGHGDQSSSEQMYEVLVDVMRRADTGINVGYAIVYECIRTVTWIYPNVTLLDNAAAAIARFVSSENHNLKYLGITGLAELVKDHPKYAAQHQVAVIECLEDPDDTLRRKTLDLLYRMINPVNVEFIAEKLLSFLESSSDEFLRKDLVGRISTSAERFAPDNGWYVRTMTRVFEVAGDLVQPEVAHNLMALIAEGSGDDEELDQALRRESVEHLANLLLDETDDEPVHLTNLLLQIIAWVLGEYGTLIAETEASDILPVPHMMDRLCSVAERPLLDANTRAYYISALLKLCAQTGNCPHRVTALVDTFSRSTDLNVQQRCLEFRQLLNHASVMRIVLPQDASCEDVEEDGELAFLSRFVEQALANGAAPYVPPEEDEEDEEEATDAGASSAGLKFDAYEAPSQPAGGGVPAAGGLAPGAGGQVGPAGARPDGVPGGQLGAVRKANAIGSGGLKAAVSGPWGASPATTAEPAAGDASAGMLASADPSLGNGGDASTNIGLQGGAPAPDAPRELTEKEIMAAQLFGGIDGSSRKPGVSRASGRRSNRSSQSSASKAPASPSPVAPAPTPAPSQPVNLLEVDDIAVATPAAPPAPAPAAVMDLLDMSDAPPPAPAPSGAGVGLLSSDPFASVGLVAAMDSATISPTLFQYNGQTPTPLQIDTPQFGSKWTGMAAGERKVQFESSFVRTPDAFAAVASEKASFYTIQIIQKTMEGILAAQVGSSVVCAHVKVYPTVGKVQVTVRTPDPVLSTRLVEFLEQNAK
uniref:AP-4 complex subunit epsilon-1 C-terminal domain-containing protein n=1 Tax=Rhizochromulina marina TaxID=1034831 RepID=A0A7S2WTQ1_9STRA